MTEQTPPPNSPPPNNPPPNDPPPNVWDPGTLQGEDKGWFENKGYKDLGTAVGALRGLEKVVGAPKERVLILPEKADDPKWTEIHGRLGRPESADKYDFGLPPEVASSETVKALAGVLHKNGVPQGAAKDLVTWFMGEKTKQAEAGETAFQTQVGKDLDELKNELGAAYEQEIGQAKAAAKSYGVGKEAMEKLERAWGTKAMMKFFIALGKGQGEHAVDGVHAGGKQGFGTMTPQAASAKIAELYGDQGFMARYMNENAVIRQKAVEEMERYQRMAAGLAPAAA